MKRRRKHKPHKERQALQAPQQHEGFFMSKTFDRICIAVTFAALLFNIHCLFLLDHSIGWNFGRAVIVVGVSFCIIWCLLSFSRMATEHRVALSFSGACIGLWTFLALNYYYADWQQPPTVLRPDIVKVGKYPDTKRKKRGCYIDIRLEGKVKRIDYGHDQYPQLQQLSSYPIRVYNGLFGIRVFLGPESLE